MKNAFDLVGRPRFRIRFDRRGLSFFRRIRWGLSLWREIILKARLRVEREHHAERF